MNHGRWSVQQNWKRPPAEAVSTGVAYRRPAVRRLFVAACIAWLIVASCQTPCLAAKATLFMDIGATTESMSGFPRCYASDGPMTYFVQSDIEHGAELWRTDGTPAGTRMVKDVNPGELGSWPLDLVVLNGVLYFTAEDGTERWLWRSDGTAAGTTGIFPEGAHAMPFYLTKAGNTLFFAAYDVLTGIELWKSDGTASGTRVIKDIGPGSATCFPVSYDDGRVVLREVGDALLFFAGESEERMGLWRTDGTGAGTRMIRDFTGEPGISKMWTVGATSTTLYFSPNGSSLWKSDGTEAGTVEVAPLPHSGKTGEMLVTPGGNAFFTAPSGLYKTDGTAEGTSFVGLEGDLSCHPLGQLNAWGAVLGETLFFPIEKGRTSSARGLIELWKSDGSDAGTTRVKTFNPVSPGCFPYGFQAVGDLFFFIADDGNGCRLWRSDGTEPGTVAVTAICSASGATASLFPADPDISRRLRPFSYEDISCFPELFGSNHGLLVGSRWGRFWKTDGTDTGTVLLSDNGVYSGSAPAPLATLGGQMVFLSHGDTDGLRATDGTISGTVLLKEFPRRTVHEHACVPAGDTLFFYFVDGMDWVLWKTDGTPSGTRLVKRFANMHADKVVAMNGCIYFGLEGDLWRSDGTKTGTGIVGTWECLYNSMWVADNTLFFLAGQNGTGPALHRSDGTASGTAKVKEVWPQTLAVAGNTVFLLAYAPGMGLMLWKTDGTENGTVPIKEVPGRCGEPVSMGGRLYFTGYTAERGTELWTSDGTEEGTVMVKRISTAYWCGSSQPLKVANGTLYFSAYDSVHGEELWRSDGTADGTFMLKDIMPGVTGSQPSQVLQTLDDGTFIFAASNGIDGYELWTSDGTEAGTQMLDDILPGYASSNPGRFMKLGNNVFFAADGGAAAGGPGKELWTIPAESTPAGLKGHWTRPCSVFTKGVGAKQRQYVRGQLAVRNTSGQSLARGTVKVYLANASTADPSHDTLLKVLRLGVLHDGAEQPRAINIRVTEGIDLSGMWVVAVIAFDDGPDTRTVLAASGPLGTRAD